MRIDDSDVQPEIVLPAQLNDALFTGAKLQPEKRLQLAVLTDAVVTYERCAGLDRTRAQNLFAEVAEWFASDATDGPFTFVSVCDSLGFEPGYIRLGLQRSRAEGNGFLKRRLSLRHHNGMRHQVVPPRLRRVA